jgi:hypothetical protein
MKIGDIIYRKDMPQILYRVVGNDRKRKMWEVELVSSRKGHSVYKGLIAKGDERWEEMRK